jgi:AraC-like DNA-binding protein
LDRTFVRTIRGSGRVFGIKFRAGAFFPFVGRSLGPLAGRRVPAARVLGAEATRWAACSAAAGDDEARAALADAYWRSLRRASSALFTDGPPRATVIAEQIAADRSIVSVSQAAEAAGTDPRTLQRLFSREVGIRPKELIRRFRLQESAERLLRDPLLSSGDLALELGYFDQAHFIHDFRAVVGTTPEEYRRRQRQR